MQAKGQYRIGVIDSGFGGLGVLSYLQTFMPEEEFFYFADTLNNPYGEKPPEAIAAYLTEIVGGLLVRRIKALVIACNTASVVYRRLPQKHPVKTSLRQAGIAVITMTEPANLASLDALRPKHITLLATRLTVESGIYPEMIRHWSPEADIQQIAAGRLVRLIEAPLADESADKAAKSEAVAEIFRIAGLQRTDAVILGCTHFTHLKREIAAHFKQKTKIIDPAAALSMNAKSLLETLHLARQKKPEERAPKQGFTFFTNGKEAALSETLEKLGAKMPFQVRRVDVRNDLSGKRVNVIGFGATGQSIVRYLLEKMPASITVHDKIESIKDAVEKAFPHAEILTKGGEGYLEGLEASDIVFRSPGVSADLAPFKKLTELGVPIFGDMDIFLEEAPGRKIAISGTNGKTTTTLLTHHLFERQEGVDARILGNIGKPVLDSLAGMSEKSMSVLEMSSFQLEKLHLLPVDISILLNITPDHLDRHGGFAEYAHAKGRIFTLLNREAHAIYNIDSFPIVNMLLPKGTKGRPLPFSPTRILPLGAGFDGKDLLLKLETGEALLIEDYQRKKRFSGKHNLENLLSASLAAFVSGVNPAIIEDVLLRFAGVEYRIEKFFEHQGVAYYDDSKGTNPDATLQALQTLREPVLLLCGGDSKGLTFELLAHAARGRVRRAFVFGEAADALFDLFSMEDISVTQVESLEAATLAAKAKAEAGDAVLFSPASASPAGEKYYQRGERFKTLVRSFGDNELASQAADDLYLKDPLANP